MNNLPTIKTDTEFARAHINKYLLILLRRGELKRYWNTATFLLVCSIVFKLSISLHTAIDHTFLI